MFRPMVNTSILCDEVQTVYTRGPEGWGWALLSCYPKVMARSSQGHGKVTEKSNQYKGVE